MFVLLTDVWLFFWRTFLPALATVPLTELALGRPRYTLGSGVLDVDDVAGAHLVVVDFSIQSLHRPVSRAERSVAWCLHLAW